MTRTTITERAPGGAAVLTTPTDAPTGRLRIGIISPGWGSSGHYSEKVLRNALDAGIWHEGLHLYLNHPSETERRDRPERDVRDIAAVATSDATWDDDFGGPVIEARAVGRYRDLLTDPTFLDAIGVSIVATGHMTEGEADGRRGNLITELTECLSVDFVTRAGRGGRVLALMESTRPHLSEAATDDMRDQLQRAAQAAYAGPGRWVFLRDFDPDRAVAWIATHTDDGDEHLWEHPYIDTDGTLTLTGTPTEVRAVTVYQPLTPATVTETAHTPPHHEPPVPPAGYTTHVQEDTMPQIEEARLRQLEEAASRVQAIEAERDQARTELAEARRVAREAQAVQVITAAEAEHRVQFTPLERRGLTAGLPTTSTGALDTDALTRTVAEAAAEKAAATGAGQVHGYGSAPVTESTPITWDDIPGFQEA